MARVQGFVEFLASRDRDRQAVLLRSQRAGGIRGDRARRVISAIEIQHHSSIAHRAGIEETSAGVGVAFCAGVAENEKQTLLRTSPERSQLELWP